MTLKNEFSMSMIDSHSVVTVSDCRVSLAVTWMRDMADYSLAHWQSRLQATWRRRQEQECKQTMASEAVCMTLACLCLYANLSFGMLFGVHQLSSTKTNYTVNCWIIKTLWLQTLPSPPQTHILRVTYLPEKRQNTHQSKLKKDLIASIFFVSRFSTSLNSTRPARQFILHVL